MFHDNVSPDFPEHQQPVIGLIGMGEMGRMYAKHLSAAGWRRINVCDLPSKYESLKADYSDVLGVTVLPDGFAVSRASDFIMYSVEAEFIDRVVKEYGPATKIGAVVAGQTSVKAPERAAFEAHLPQDVHIVSCHSLHGPTVSPRGQPLVLIHHRGPQAALRLVENILRPFQSRYVYMSFDEHDRVTANTQAVTHAAFLSMGTAWNSEGEYPWETPQGMYSGGMETVKVNIAHRIYASKWHVYAGLAILNPSARLQIEQYARSATELFKLMLDQNEKGLRERIYRAREVVFIQNAPQHSSPILLSEEFLDKFSISSNRRDSATATTNVQKNEGSKRNSHLSLLAMADCWLQLSINPFQHLELAATPIFRMWIGVAEYLFRDLKRLDGAIEAALFDTTFRSNDMEFVLAARGWFECVEFGNFELYRRRFERTAAFFRPRFAEAQVLATKMIAAILEEQERKERGQAAV